VIRVFKTRAFVRMMRKSGVRDDDLCGAVGEMEGGLVDADLGGGVLKKRVALPGKGKRGSARTIVATNKDDRWVFVFGFKKNDRANVTDAELGALRKIALDLMKQSSANLDALIVQGELEEICNATEA
jgi:hypothetical protein